jgi:hypothetical protein
MGLYPAAQWCRLVMSCLDWAYNELVLVLHSHRAALPLMRLTQEYTCWKDCSLHVRHVGKHQIRQQ